MVHILAMMSLLKIMPTVTATQKHAWAITILFHLQCCASTQSWPGMGASHLMRWRYFILTRPAKCKITQTVIFITINRTEKKMDDLLSCNT